MPTHFLTIGPNECELLFGHWYLFVKKRNYDQKLNLGIFWGGLKLFQDFKIKIGPQQFFIIWHLCIPIYMHILGQENATF